MVWNAEDPRVPPGEKRGSGEGNLGLFPHPLGFAGASPGSRTGKTSGKRRRRRAKRSTTDWGGLGVGQQCRRSKGPPQRERGWPVSARQDPDGLGREAVRESCRASMTRWSLCKLSDPAPQTGLVCATARSGPACLPRPDTHSREQQKDRQISAGPSRWGWEGPSLLSPALPGTQ